MLNASYRDLIESVLFEEFLMRKNLIETIFLGVLAAILLTSTYFAHQWLQYVDEPNVIRIFNVQDSESVQIENRLKKMSYATLSRVDMIIVVDKLHPDYCGQCIRTAKLEQFIIIIDKQNIANGTIWHEIGHAHLSSLPEKAWDEWRSMPGRLAYSGDEWRDNIFHNFPTNGFASPYGTKNIEEDVACWVEMVYRKLYGEISFLDFPFDKEAPIYDSIFQWLFKWDFITKEHYDALLVILHS